MNRCGSKGLLLVVAVSIAAALAQAEPGRQPAQAFDVDDGLADSFIVRIVADSKGFLWFCTARGLSRFDGSDFVNFGDDEGLHGPVVYDLAEDRDGSTVWVGTSAGLFRLAGDRVTDGGSMFEPVGLPVGAAAVRLLVDRRGRVWIGTSEGLAVLEPDGGGVPRQVLPVEPGDPEVGSVLALFESADGALWAGTHSGGLYRVDPDSSAVGHWPADLPGLFFIRDLARGPDGRMWGTFLGGVARFHEHPETLSDPVAEIFDHASGLPSIDTSHLLAGSEGAILAGTTAGVARLARDSVGEWSVTGRWSTLDGLTSDFVTALARDPAGNVWTGSRSRGVVKFAGSGFRHYPEVEEGASMIVSLLDDGAGGMLALAAFEQRRYRLHRLTETEHSTIDVAFPPGLAYLGWGWPRLVLDDAGGWWLSTGKGLLHYQDRGGVGSGSLEHSPDETFGPAQGLPGDDVFAVFQDSRGGLWVGVSEPLPGRSSVAFRERGASAFATLPETTGSDPGDLATGFVEDPEGRVWITFASGRVVRGLPGGEFAPVAFEPALPGSRAVRLAFDSRGRLWIGGDDGALVADEPSAGTVRVRPGPSSLAGARVDCVVEDDTGRLYFGTDRGVLRFDERDDGVRRFTPADGLPGERISLCRRDSRGDLWFADMHGLARLRPVADPVFPAAQVRIAAVHVDGDPLAVAPLGLTALGPLVLRSRPRHVDVRFFAINHAPGGPTLFQHQFATGGVWSEPSESRRLEFAHLASGRHRLSIRALTPSGRPAPAAELEIAVPFPLWRRPWFVALALCAGLVTIVAVYRARLARALELERMRTRIATDLHDEVGADLSRISLLADFAQRELDAQPGDSRAMLGEIARTARGAVTDMSDIVWALKPGSETLSQVIARVRDFAAEVAANAGIAMRTSVGDDLDGVALTGDRRRDLYLLLKEAVTNAVRHSGARALDFEVCRSGRAIVATLRDDGRGFSPGTPPTPRGGHGLDNMRGRAERLGGTFSIESSPGSGTTVRIELSGA